MRSEHTRVPPRRQKDAARGSALLNRERGAASALTGRPPAGTYRDPRSAHRSSRDHFGEQFTPPATGNFVANHTQALKRHKQSLKRAERNSYFETTARTYLKRAHQALDAGDKAAATPAVAQVISWLDHVRGKGVVHANKASRLKSRLTRRLNAL
jgi:small subunit ribosomal protein S20